MTITRTTYNYREGISSKATWFGGGHMSTSYTFPDEINDAISIDFAGMKTGGGKAWVNIRNTTLRQNGGFSVNAYDINDNIIATTTLAVNKNVTKTFNDLPKITIPDGSSVKKLIFFSRRQRAHMSLNHDTTSEFSIMVNRDPLLKPTVEKKDLTTAKLSWGENLTGNYRIVQRVKNAYRNIANESDIVLLENVTGSSATLSGLSMNSKYIAVLQKLGNEWYDIGQVTFKTELVDIDLQIEEVGSRYMKLKWNNESGYTLEVTATSPGDIKSVVTSEKNSVIIRDLLPGVNYEVQVSLV